MKNSNSKKRSNKLKITKTTYIDTISRELLLLESEETRVNSELVLVTEIYYNKDGKLHRTDGPAYCSYNLKNGSRIFEGGFKAWFNNGVQVSENYFKV